MNHARIRICGPWASRCRLLSIFSLVCKTKIGLPASRESSEHQKQGDNAPPSSVCMVHCDAWPGGRSPGHDNSFLLTPGFLLQSCIRHFEHIHSFDFFFLLYSLRSLNGIRNHSSFWLHFYPSIPQCLSSLIFQTL